MKTFVLLPIVLALICNLVEHAESQCPANGTLSYNSTSGIIDVTNTTCTFVVVNIFSASNTLNFKQMALKNNDTLVIYDGNQEEKKIIVSYNAASKVETRLVVGTSTNLTIVYTASPTNYSGSSWSIFYNTKECDVTIENFWATRIDSPIFYIPKNSSELANKTTAVNCTYTVNSNALPSDQNVVVSVGQFSLKGNSSLTLNDSVQAIKEYKENSTKDDFFVKSSKSFQATLSIQNTSLQQEFSLVIGAVVEACSGVSTESWTLTQLPSQPVGFECRQLIQLPKSSSVFQVRLNSLTVVPGSDKFTVIQGSSINAQALASITTDVTDYLLIAPGSAIIISYVSNSIVGYRSINLTVTGSGYGGYLNGQGQLTFTNKSNAEDVYYQLVADQHQVVKVTILSELGANSTVSFYNGLQQTDTPILTLSNESQLLKEIIGGPAMLVKLSGFLNNSSFTANFTSIQSGCDSVATDSSGHISYSRESVGQSCSFVIAPQKVTGTIIVVLDSLTLKNDATVKVYAGHGNKKLVAEFVSPVENQLNAPQIYVPVADTISIIVSGAASITGHYLTFPGVCGGALKNPSDTILTPNYPNQYPLNADCVWYTKDTSKQFVYLSFQDFVLAGNHTIDIVNVTNSSSPQVLESFGSGQSANQLPGDVVIAWNNNTQIQFNSHHEETTQVARGANISTRVIECGGTFRSNGALQSPDYPTTKNTSCVWVIDVHEELGQNRTSIVNFTLKTSDYASVDNFLRIHDGDSIRSPLLALPKSEEHSILSRYDRIVIFFNSTTKLAAVQVNFTTKICTELCHNGICLHDDWRCNGVDDCGDNTDEQNCNTTSTTPSPPSPPPTSPQPTIKPPSTTTSKPPVQDYSGWVKSGWVPGCLFIGLLLGALLVFAVPKVIRRLRHSSSNYSRMGDNVANA